MKKIIAMLLAGWLVVCCGCAQVASSADGQQEEVVYADQEAVEAIGRGLEERFDYADAVDETTGETLAEATEIEIEKLAPFRSRLFESSKLQERVLAYLNLLEEAKELTGAMSVNDDAFYDSWNSLYDQRAMALKEFVDSYGLMVDEGHQSALDDLLRRGRAVEKSGAENEAVEQLVASLNFEKTSDEDGWFFTYAATGENTTELDLENISLILALYDGDGVKVEETYASTSSWLRGEKVRFEAISEVDAAEVKVSLDSYSIAD
ncbi:FxLYD domain-containing protein [Adlercreutzia sp. R25]|uniref:FxLYD domain-containing protein n=1 Tax=Adlercreutzia shanghongiae TaxID=3111773 RepID=UPI002DB66EC1|nr:FxLYD domain-containing protein [Adlercreutzia sp. R25]MEC4273351.1 FxLYD domain-containing protein [Adlercreutzia sp. R25]